MLPKHRSQPNYIFWKVTAQKLFEVEVTMPGDAARRFLAEISSRRVEHPLLAMRLCLSPREGRPYHHATILTESFSGLAHLFGFDF
jgi:hypothetical protein